MNVKIIPPGAGQYRNVLGDNVTIKITGDDTGGAFMMAEQSNPPGVGIPMHIHNNEDELFHVVEGSVTFTVDGQTVLAEAGATVLLPRGIPHSFMMTGEALTKTRVMTFPSGIEHMFQELSDLPSGPPDMPRVFEICARYGITFLAPPDPAEDSLSSV